MKKAEIYLQINNWERKQYTYIGDYQRLEEKLEKLNRLLGKVSSLKGDFNTNRQYRITRLSALSSLGSQLKSISCYISGMEDLLSGSEYEHVNLGLENLISETEREIAYTENEINMTRANLSFCSSKISSLYSELYIAEE